LFAIRALVKFDISGNTILAAGGQALAAAIKNNQVLTELNIGSNRLGQRINDADTLYETDVSGVIAISNAIPTMGALTSLNISDNNIGNAVAELDAGWEQRFRECVISFDKDGDGILNRSELGSFCEASKLEVERNIKFFCHDADEASEDFLQDGDMTVEGLVSFFKSASKSRPSAVIRELKTLKLLSEKPVGAIAIADAIKNNGALVKLDISKNDLYAAGGKALAEALHGNQVMTELNLAGNSLGPVQRKGAADMWGITAVSGAIPTMGALTSLNISNNMLGGKYSDGSGGDAPYDAPYTAAGLKALREMLQTNADLHIAI
jgi:hypothetical protein